MVLDNVKTKDEIVFDWITQTPMQYLHTSYILYITQPYNVRNTDLTLQ